MPLPSRDDVEVRLLLAETGGGVPEIDLHGLRADEAVTAAERFIQSAFAHGALAVRLIHGKGEGRLREALGRLLGEHPLVARFREAVAGGSTLAAFVER